MAMAGWIESLDRIWFPAACLFRGHMELGIAADHRQTIGPLVCRAEPQFRKVDPWPELRLRFRFCSQHQNQFRCHEACGYRGGILQRARSRWPLREFGKAAASDLPDARPELFSRLGIQSRDRDW